MAKYTTTVRALIASQFDFKLTSYPIFTETYRQNLNDKILNHYKDYEIGMETPALFREYLNMRMAEIMPYYNKLYQSELLILEPLLSYKHNEQKNSTVTDNTTITNTGTVGTTGTNSDTRTDNTTSETNGTNTGTNNHSLTNTDNNKDIFSDTPSTLLSDANINDNYYATNAHRIVNSSTGTDNNVLNLANSNIIKNTGTVSNAGSISNTVTNNLTNTSDGTHTITDNNSDSGFNIPQAELLQKYRDTFLNIDLQVINELSDLFILVY